MCVRWKKARQGENFLKKERKRPKKLLCSSHPFDRERERVGGGGASKLNTVSKGYREGKNMKGQLQKTKTMRALMKTTCKHSLQVDIKVMSLRCPKEN